MEDIKHLTKGQSDWQVTVNEIIDHLSKNSDKWSEPSITGVVFKNGCTNNNGHCSYSTYDLGDKRLVSFHWSITLNNVPDNAKTMTDVAQVPDSLLPINGEAHGTYLGGGAAFSIGIYDNGRVEVSCTNNLANGMAPRFTMFYLANKAN